MEIRDVLQQLPHTVLVEMLMAIYLRHDILREQIDKIIDELLKELRE